MRTKVFIDTERCKGCEYCRFVCPKRVIHMSGDLNNRGYHHALISDVNECSGCGLCVLMCPEIAIEIKADDQ